MMTDKDSLEQQFGKLNIMLIRAILNNDEKSAIEIKRQIKTNNSINLKFNDFSYMCSLCKDTGIINGKQCQCVKKRAKDKRIARFLKATGLQGSQLRETFDSFNFSYYKDIVISDKIGLTFRQNAEEVFDSVKNFSNSCIDGAPQKSIYVFGEPGRGKTYLMNCVANELMGRGIQFIYTKYDRLLADIQSSYSPESRHSTEEILSEVIGIEVLLLDDLGVEKPSDDAGLKLYRIIDERLLRNLPTFITSNFSIAELGSRYADEMLGKRITSRIAQLCEIMQLYANKDIRLQASKLAR